MTESEWRAATDPSVMFQLGGKGRRNGPRFKAALALMASERKLRLFGCGCFRLTFRRPNFAADRNVLETAERYADGAATAAELAAAGRRCGATASLLSHQEADRVARSGVGTGARAGHPAGVPTLLTSADRSDLLRCVFGNPFRPVAADPSWLTSAVTGLAAAIYADRAFDRLPVLADALEEAGCDHPDVLTHCRDGGPHARGCWVVDIVLGKT